MRTISPILTLPLLFGTCQFSIPMPLSSSQSPNDQTETTNSNSTTVCPFLLDGTSCMNHKNECEVDEDCSRGQVSKSCCYNGCNMVCIEQLKAAPVIDWLVEPKPEKNSRYFWLTDEGGDQGGSEETSRENRDHLTVQSQFSRSSEHEASELPTPAISGPSADDKVPEFADCAIPSLSEYEMGSTPLEDPRHCPEGYECILFDMGDTERGIAGRGWCQLIRKYVL